MANPYEVSPHMFLPDPSGPYFEIVPSQARRLSPEAFTGTLFAFLSLRAHNFSITE
jgi:hypothetical protein